MFLLRDLDEVVKRLQEPMTNALMIVCGKKRVLERFDKVEESRGKRRKFKEAVTEAKINELSYKKFLVESKKKIQWAVNMYDSWKANRLLDPFVVSQIRCANLSSLNNFTQGDLAFSLCRFITEVKRLS